MSVVDAADARLDRLVGDKTAKALDDQLGLRTVGDLLRHYPRRYARRGELTDLVRPRVGEQVTVLAKVASASAVRRHAQPAQAAPARGHRSPTAPAG